MFSAQILNKNVISILYCFFQLLIILWQVCLFIWQKILSVLQSQLITKFKYLIYLIYIAIRLPDTGSILKCKCDFYYHRLSNFFTWGKFWCFLQVFLITFEVFSALWHFHSLFDIFITLDIWSNSGQRKLISG